MDKDSVFTYVQDLFRRGVVVVVGSGASCGYGLPGMASLSTHLLTTVPSRLSGSCVHSTSEWGRISTALSSGTDLESALGPDGIPDELADIITTEISDLVGTAESDAILRILDDRECSAFGRLFKHVLRTNDVADVITTNYDRLLEVHAARAEVRVDTMYYGHTIGRLDEQLSRQELLHGRNLAGKATSVQLRTRPHVRLAKPHGSLDWYSHQGQSFRSELRLPGSRQIVAPGGNKYRLGYEIPFDAQRKRANHAIDNATALLFVGYGFNDAHLQTHLRQRFPQVPSVVLARELTANARDYLGLNSTSIGIERMHDGSGCSVTQNDDILPLPESLWDLECLLKEVLAI